METELEQLNRLVDAPEVCVGCGDVACRYVLVITHFQGRLDELFRVCAISELRMHQRCYQHHVWIVRRHALRIFNVVQYQPGRIATLQADHRGEGSVVGIGVQIEYALRPIERGIVVTSLLNIFLQSKDRVGR